MASTLGFEVKFKQKRQRKQKSAAFGESSSLAHEHENEVEKFKVEVFYVALDKLMQEITRRSQTVAKIHNIFSFIWNAKGSDEQSNIKKAEELSKVYPKDLILSEFVEETRHMSQVQETLFGNVTSIDLLNFPQTCIAIRMYITLLVVGNVLLVN